MHSSNFVVIITLILKITVFRAIDFDQQSYEGSCSVYMALQYFRINAIIELE
jgi:hypothetical protein